LGSTSFHVLHNAVSSVLVAHGVPRPGPLKVLVATDGSAEAEHAAGVLAAFADPGRCTVTVISVAQVPTTALSPVPSAPSVRVPPRTGSRASSRRPPGAPHAAANALADRGFACTTIVREGSPRTSILAENEEGGHAIGPQDLRGPREFQAAA
jgi:nucleotide-binding universal stress UspA family protein